MRNRSVTAALRVGCLNRCHKGVALDAEVFVGKDLDDAVAFQLAIGSAGEVCREAGKQAEQRHDEISKALKAELAKFQHATGVIMDSSSWKVKAKNPQ
jgi:hypothetical protein